MINKDLDYSKTGILLLSHGSRLPQGEKVIKDYVDMYKNEYPDIPVDFGFMEIREPNIQQAISNLNKNNSLERIIVVPVFIAHGLHTKRDIPAILGIETDFDEEEHSNHNHHHHHHHHTHEKVDFDGEIILTDPLGADTRIFEIIKDRVFENL